ncbi:MAG: ATP-grasp domain-containing protein [Actinomycetota bacterium]|nr:ATP-grasp domain-containing protein [Actinomycetota bacterium]
MTSVLVTDGLWRKSLSAVRSLGRQDIEVGVTGDSPFTTAFYSRYCRRRVRLPKATDEAYIDAFLEELSRHRYDVVLPMEDDTTQVLLRHRDQVEALSRLPLPSASSLAVAADKAATLELAASLGIAHPWTRRPQSEAELEAILADIPLPAVVKPVNSSGSRGLHYADTRDQVRAAFRAVLPVYGAPLVQERIPGGPGLGAGLLFGPGAEPLAGFTYRRLREYPVQGGPSTLRESTHDPALLESATRLLEALDWFGVAMVEFKLDPRDGVAKLMEINPRFWGSLELANASGVNFPWLLAQTALGRAPEPSFDYRDGVRCRWLVPGDILHFLSNPDRFDMDPSFFSFFDGMHYDDFARDDLRGSVATVVCTAAQAMRPEMWKLAITR